MIAIDNDSRARVADAVCDLFQMDDEPIIKAAESLRFPEY